MMTREVLLQVRDDDTEPIHLLSVLERSFLLIEGYRTTLSENVKKSKYRFG
jgi:hypothetical protein